MREIIFRGLMVTGEWVYGLPYNDAPGSTAYFAECCQRICWITGGGTYHNAPIKKGTLGQFTGCQDKEGRLIYEGDIVLTWGEGGEEDNESEESKAIIFDTQIGQWCWGKDGGNSCPLYEIDQDFMEVVGNIYENADLLKA